MIPNSAYRLKDSLSTHRYRYLAVALLLVLAIFFSAGPAKSSTIPTFSIASVVMDNSVTITPYNFPPNQTFTVTMGPYGSLGIGGYVVDTVTTDAAGTLSKTTFATPTQLYGSYRIAIRLQTGHAYPYYAYNWFYNNTTGTGGPGPGPGPGTGYTGFPTFSIATVNRDVDVTITPNNFPPNQTFTVTMGPMGSRGIGGTFVDTVTTDAAGVLSKTTYNIPAALAGSYQIAIRLQTGHANPYFAYNWFYNNTTGTGGPGPGPGPGPSPGYTGIPTFKVCEVARDASVRIAPNNFPPNQTFTVTMGYMWTQGIGGFNAGTVTTDASGNLSATTFTIPAQLAGQWQISIRLQTGQAYPYYAYNWFYNNTAVVC